MPRRKNISESSEPSHKRPARTPDEWENTCINYAFELVERRLREGTATSAETVHFLKLGSTKERLERKLLERQTELLEAKRENLQSAARMEEIYTNALHAMKEYSGQPVEDEE